MDIAIIGMSCRFPESDNYNDFWRLLINGKSAVKEVPKKRWNIANLYQDNTENLSHKNTVANQHGGFIDNIDEFDANFFRISAIEAESMDPQQRLVMELAWHCIEDSGYSPHALKGTSTGVFLGVSTYDYKQIQDKQGHIPVGHEATGVHNSIVANRISYFFNWYGPSIVVDTACSSSHVAINSAISAIENGDCESALVGGVNLLMTPTTFVRFNKMGMLSPSGKIHAFDENADGYVRGEGGGFIYLKKLEDAQRDNDHVLAVIKSSAINHGGKVKSLTSPNAIAQSKVIVSAIEKANIPPSSISYIEAHGTGTPMGDPIEFNGLLRAFRHSAKLNNEKLTEKQCAIATVKTNIGHLEAAAGIAGVIKVVLAFKHNLLPKSLNLKKINPRIKIKNSPFYLLNRSQPWVPDSSGLPRRAGISSFGFGGVNGHLILEEPPQNTKSSVQKNPNDVIHSEQQLFTLSAKSESSLQQLVKRYITLLKTKNSHFPDFCATVNQASCHHKWRLALVANSANTAITKLQQYLQKDPNIDAAQSTCCEDISQNIAFLFTGQGAQYQGMGQVLFNTQTVYHDAFHECDKQFYPYLKLSIVDLLYGDNDSKHAIELLNNTRYTQPALFAFEYALNIFWQALGVKPKAVIGHSVGEIVAACIAGVFSLQDAIKLVASRSQVMASLEDNGAMLAVTASEDQVRTVIDQVNQKLTTQTSQIDIAAINAHNSIVISGLRSSIDIVFESFSSMGITTTFLNVSQAFHSCLLDPVLTQFNAEIAGLTYAKPKLTLVSNITGELADSNVSDAFYWVDQIRKPVHFAQGIKTLEATGATVFLELGPKPHLSTLAQRTVGSNVDIIASNLGKEDEQQILQIVAELYLKGVNIDFSPLLNNAQVDRRIDLPLYPFDRKSYWVSGVKAQYGGDVLENHSYQFPWLGNLRNIPLLETEIISYETLLPSNMGAFLADHKVNNKCVVPAAAYISLVLSAINKSMLFNPQALIVIKKIEFLRVLPFHEDEDIVVQVVLSNRNKTGWEFSILSKTSISADNSASWEVYAQGKYESKEATLLDLSINFADLDELQPIDVASVYQQCAKIGLQYGKHFQALRSLEKNERFVRAQLQLPEGVEAVPEMLSTVHPILLDAAFQALATLALDNNEISGQLLLPVGVDALSISCQQMTASLNTLEVFATIKQRNATKIIATLELLDSNQNIVANIDGLHLTWVNIQTLSQQIGADWIPQMFYSPQLKKLETPKKNALSSVTTNQQHNILYIANCPDIKKMLFAIDQTAQQNYFIEMDTVFFNQTSGVLRWDTNSHNDLVNILQSLPILRKIVYLVPQNQDQTSDSSVTYLYRILQALVTCGYAEKTLSLFVLSAPAPAPAPENLQQASQESIAIDGAFRAATTGLARSVAHEYTHWAVKSIDITSIDDNPTQLLFDRIMRLSEEYGNERLTYIDGHFYQQSCVPVVLNKKETSPYKIAGVYIIFGGAGGIGFSLADHLITHYQAKVALVGRSLPGDLIKTKIQALNQTNGFLKHYQTDLTILAEVEDVIALVIQELGDINGIIHSAAVVNDSSFKTLLEKQLNHVLAPKVIGSINLAAATRTLTLDFMLLFSSAVTQFGSAGQANYVAANAFMDHFGAQLNDQRAYPVKVINWGFWGEIGMASSDFYHQAFAKIGLLPLQTQEGIEAITRVLSAFEQQFVVIKAENSALEEGDFDLETLWFEQHNQLTPDLEHRYQHQSFSLDNNESSSAPEIIIPTAEEIKSSNDQEMDHLITQGLSGIMCQVLRFDVVNECGGIEQFKTVRITSLGIDSLTTTELRHRIYAWVEVDIPPDMVIGGSRITEVIDAIKSKMLLNQLRTTLFSKESKNDDDIEVFVL